MICHLDKDNKASTERISNSVYLVWHFQSDVNEYIHSETIDRNVDANQAFENRLYLIVDWSSIEKVDLWLEINDYPC